MEKSNEYDQLRDNVEKLTLQCKQLEEANNVWQQYQKNQLMILQDRFKLDNPSNINLSFDDIIQQIEGRFVNLQNQYDTQRNQIFEKQGIFHNIKSIHERTIFVFF